ncbi:MAG: acyl-CoA dehydrogenase [Deltaproteobacteria bacterium]|nr:MAG: acyl-CoA dehydrogenase [Deltaproteobacteria bacterium]
MAQILADRRDISFVLHELYEIGNLSQHEKYADFGPKVIDMVVNEARTLAVKEIYPTWKTGDEEGCTYTNGEVTTPEGFKAAWDLLVEGEWLAMDRNVDWGGQGMPETLAMAAREYLTAANMALLMISILNHGSGKIIEIFGNDKQKALYLKKVYSGEWGATMLLTEAEAGSDLSALTTTATKNDDGTYSLVGNKLFITAGETDLSENIIHPVLARIEGAPAGSKGISLFLVPKFWVNDDGSLGERNDIVCTGIEEKMGLHGSPTCTMSLGSKGKCIGTLLGEENKGLMSMFYMMNEARLSTGTQALSCSSASYLHALDYARTRMQGPMMGAKEKKQVAIINHPDVRRMLMNMKMFVDGMRSLHYYIASREDFKQFVDDPAEKEKMQNVIDILIPIAKGYVTDRAVEVCNIGIQIFGGYGYTKEFPVEQLLRDVRITAIYEGTNGIQAIDLLGRKLGMKGGQLLTDLMTEMKKTIDLAKGMDPLKALAEKTETVMQEWENAARHLSETASGPNMLKGYAHACPLMQITGDVVMAWLLLWRAVVAKQKLNGKVKKKDIAFYEGQVQTAEYFIRTVLPVTTGLVNTVLDTCGVAVELEDASFGGK